VAPASDFLDDIWRFWRIFVVVCFGQKTKTFKYSVSTGIVSAEQIAL
jgi:hypothetical protein